MTDKELLEAAARAAGMHEWRFTGSSMSRMIDPARADSGSIGPNWNPLTDDGDAFRLSVRLHMDILPDDDSVLVFKMNHQRFQAEEPYRNDARAATRRAIVRAAASIGQSGQAQHQGEGE